MYRPAQGISMDLLNLPPVPAHATGILFVLLFVARCGDILSTRLATPHLKLEANPIVRKLGWPFAFATLLIALLPFLDVRLGIVALVPSLLVSSSNFARVWMMRTLGEEEMQALMRRAAAKSKRSRALLCVMASAFFIVLAGAVLMWLSTPADAAAFFGAGIILYGFVVALYGSAQVKRLFQSVQAEATAETHA